MMTPMILAPPKNQTIVSFLNIDDANVSGTNKKDTVLTPKTLTSPKYNPTSGSSEK